VCRYGIKGPVYLRSKTGEVAHICEDGAVEWTAGQVIKQASHVIVDSVLGQQKYDLLDHITVRNLTGFSLDNRLFKG